MTRFDYPHYDHPTLAAFAGVAKEYCDIVDNLGEVTPEEFIVAVHRVLPLLYARALALPSTDVLYDMSSEEEAQDEAAPTEDNADRRSHEEWATLMRQLAAALGPERYYREVFDPYEPPEEGEVRADLADDIADIYADVREGLAKWTRGETGAALWVWRFNFQVHWGEHATGALRALWVRAAWHDHPWPAGGPHAA